MPQAKKEIYGKSTQGTYNVEKYIQRVTTLSLTLRVYIYSFSSCCLSNCNSPKFRNKDHPGSSIMVSIDVTWFTKGQGRDSDIFRCKYLENG